MRTLAERCALIELLVLDVDGVLTDGSIVYVGASEEIKAFHVRDGSGLKLWHKAGKQSAIITGRESVVVERRAAELGIRHVFQGVADKLDTMRALWKKTGFQAEQTAAIGDDIPDVQVLRSVGLAIAVGDGCAEARQEAQYVTSACGGRGAVREAIEIVLKCQGKWK